MRIVIGLTGLAGSGKDTVARLLAQNYGATGIAFADPLKDEIADVWRVDRALLDDPSTKEVPSSALALHRCNDAGFIERHWELAGLAALKPRTVMTAWGDWRRAGDPGYFVNLAEHALVDSAFCRRPGPVVVTDVRYRNELAMLRRYAAEVWRVFRPGLLPRSGHSSERELADTPVDALILNNGSLELLEKISADLYLALRDRRAA